MQITAEVKVHDYIEFIYDCSAVHLSMYSLSTQPKRYVEQACVGASIRSKTKEIDTRVWFYL